ncbi:MAG TPA: ANTAR domain-containing protein [Candidatus Binatia bacterium]|nr:ANTAR domain-containing protein [Candidatus Binatia bacterium]
MRRVLVIDDHLPSRKVLTEASTANGLEIVGEGTSGQSAPVLALTAEPDVILMAVGLPDLDGIRAARNIMEAKPVPILLLTSHHDAKTIERAKRAGVMGVLIKPLRVEEVVPAIELAISRFQELVSLRQENKNLRTTLEARKTIERAKGLLMKHRGLSEAEAFSLIQKKSMDLRKPMVEIAQAIILAEEVKKGKTG